MISVSNDLKELFVAPVRHFVSFISWYDTDGNFDYFDIDEIQSFTVEKLGEEGKFFGYGVSKKINIKVIDAERLCHIASHNTLFPFFNNYDGVSLGKFIVTEVNRDENDNSLSITGYDAISNEAVKHTFTELNLTPPYTIYDVAKAIVDSKLIVDGELVLKGTIINNPNLYLNYENGANFDGTETWREVLDAIAEATQSIYYIDGDHNLVFKGFDVGEAADLTITRDDYFTLDSKENRRLSTIVHATELGDNVSVTTGVSGSTQYIRDNPFLELRDDIDTILDNAIAAVGGLTINQFTCSWRGNYSLEIGDKIELITKDGNSVYSYFVNDTTTFNGALTQDTSWKYGDNETETESNPSNLGDALKKTFARVDKANKNIELLASEQEADRESMAQIELDTQNINAKVENLKISTDDALAGVNNNLADIVNTVEAKMSADDVQLKITEALDNGVEKVITTTGFTFDENGLTVEKSGTEMKTQITEDGMRVFKNGEEMLTANNEGVNAVNLHATTYLIIGSNSRFENYGDNRTGCFWIGG